MILQSNHFQQVHKKYSSIEDALKAIPGVIALLEPTPLQIPQLPEQFEKPIALMNGITIQPRKGVCTCQTSQTSEKDSSLNSPCNHLITYYLSHTQAFLNLMQKSLFTQYKMGALVQHYEIKLKNTKLHVLHSENSDWIKMLGEDNPEKVYSFNLRKKRWAYNALPSWQEEIQTVLPDYFLVTG